MSEAGGAGTAAVGRPFPTRRLAGLVALVSVWLLPALLWRPVAWGALAQFVVIGALAVSDGIALRQAGRLRGRRECEPVLSLGAENAVSVTLENRGGARLHLLVRDEPPTEFQIDRRFFEFALDPGQVWGGKYHVKPLKRGNYAFGRLNARARGPLGLLMRQVSFAVGAGVRVYPNLLQTRVHELLARRDRLAQMGVRTSRLRGAGLEFEALRGYVPGDEMRRICWKATARRGRPIVREFDIERGQTVVLALDLGRTMAAQLGEMTKADYCVNACALLTYAAVKSDDRVGFFSFADEVVGFLPPGRGKGQIQRVADHLYQSQARPVESDYRGAFAALAERLNRRALVVVFTSLLDPESSRRLIRYLPVLLPRHLVMCVALSDYELEELVTARPRERQDIYTGAVALSLMEDRSTALGLLAARGAVTVDASPATLSVAVLNRYLELKRRARL